MEYAGETFYSFRHPHPLMRAQWRLAAGGLVAISALVGLLLRAGLPPVGALVMVALAVGSAFLLWLRNSIVSLGSQPGVYISPFQLVVKHWGRTCRWEWRDVESVTVESYETAPAGERAWGRLILGKDAAVPYVRIVLKRAPFFAPRLIGGTAAARAQFGRLNRTLRVYLQDPDGFAREACQYVTADPAASTAA